MSRFAGPILLLLSCLTPALCDTANHSARVSELVADGSLAEAFEAAQEWVDGEPDSIEAFLACGDLAIRCGIYDTAADCFETALFYTEDPSIAVRLGDALSGLDRGPAALESYRRALELDAGTVAAHVGIGRIQLSDPETLFEARIPLEAALAISPEDGDALTALAELALATGSRSDGVGQLRSLVTREEAPSRAHLLLGKILAQAGQKAAAAEQWERYLQREPARPESWLLQRGLFTLNSRSLPIRGSFFVFSPDGDSIAYIGAGATANQQLLKVSVDNPNQPQVLAQWEERPSGIAWSPDGSRVAVRTLVRENDAKGRQRWNYTLWTVGADGTDLREVYKDTYAGTPAWMPDGKALCIDVSVPRKGRVLRKIEDKRGAEPGDMVVSPPAGHAIQSAYWTPEGDALIATTVDYRGDRSYNVVYLPADTTGEMRVLWSSPEPVYYATPAPDGKSVLYLERDPQSTYSIHAIPVDGSRRRPATVMPGPVSASPPSMRANGAELLAYTSGGLQLVKLVGLD